ncbi:MAG: hypothetical protein ACPG6B_01445 [Oceanihabitans sp.]
MIDRVYILDHLKLVKLSLPTFFRETRTVAFVFSLFAPLIAQYERFINHKDDAIYRVSHNGSITLLQKVLNDKFDFTERRIYIKNVQLHDALRFYYQAAQKEVRFSTPAVSGFKDTVSFNAEQVDFTVHVPIEYQSNNASELANFLIQIGAQIDYYKMYAKKYEIQWIN